MDQKPKEPRGKVVKDKAVKKQLGLQTTGPAMPKYSEEQMAICPLLWFSQQGLLLPPLCSRNLKASERKSRLPQIFSLLGCSWTLTPGWQPSTQPFVNKDCLCITNDVWICMFEHAGEVCALALGWEPWMNLFLWLLYQITTISVTLNYFFSCSEDKLPF